MRNHGYSNVPDHAFWDREIVRNLVGNIDPMKGLKSFVITKEDKIATMGSCFAQHISIRLSKLGFNYFIAEGSEAGFESGYGIYSARYGNIYTILQAQQLFERALSENEQASEIWKSNNLFIDSYRPTAVPGDFKSIQELEEDKRLHLQKTRQVFETTDVLVFTLGLTEGWINVKSRQIFPISPGVRGGEFDPNLHKPFNSDVIETIDQLEYFCQTLLALNPKIKIIFTVSPVHLAATHTGKSVLTASISAKAKLRAAADYVSDKFPNVYYFPSFEIINSLTQNSQYYLSNLREVNSTGVDHVMRIFIKHFTATDQLHNNQFETSNFNAKIKCDDKLLS